MTSPDRIEQLELLSTHYRACHDEDADVIVDADGFFYINSSLGSFTFYSFDHAVREIPKLYLRP